MALSAACMGPIVRGFPLVKFSPVQLCERRDTAKATKALPGTGLLILSSSHLRTISLEYDCDHM